MKATRELSSAITSTRHCWAAPCSEIVKVAFSGSSTVTPFGTYTSTPSVHSAAFSAANFSSVPTIAPRCFSISSGCSRAACSRSMNRTPAGSEPPVSTTGEDTGANEEKSMPRRFV